MIIDSILTKRERDKTVVWGPASDVMTETGLSLLQTRDLVLATLFLARSDTLLRLGVCRSIL